MEIAQIDELAYILKQNKKNKLPGAIVFLGAGMSVTAGIPKADEIAKVILRKYKDSPSIKRIPNEKRDYHTLMNCITAADRKSLLNKYVINAKINVSHIYLSHLLCEGYIDYIVTVNFDNLTLRALSLFNQFPAVYDISILKEITTTTFDIPGVIFMHGQHHGLWQLNTDTEMKKINDTAPHIFSKIANGRPWVVVGYGASDPVFSHMVKLGRFDNNLFWVGYNDYDPPANVQSELLNKENSGAKFIKGFDADSFFMTLHNEIIVNQPDILAKPFTHIKKLQESIIDIQGEKFDGIKSRLLITRNWVQKSINEYENGKKGDNLINRQKYIERDNLKMELIDCLIRKRFDDVKNLEKKVSKSKNPKGYFEVLSSIYNNWGIELFEKAKAKPDLLDLPTNEEAKSKFRKAIEYNPNDFKAYTNLGNCTAEHAKKETSNVSDDLFTQAFSLYAKASILNKKSVEVLYCWGNDLASQANLKKIPGATKLYNLSYKKFEAAIKLNPNYPSIFYNWGTNLFHNGEKLSGNDARKLFLLASNRFEKAVSNSQYLEFLYNNWGNTFLKLAFIDEGKFELKYLKLSVEKYEKAVEINPNYFLSNSNLGNAYRILAEKSMGATAIRLYTFSIKSLLNSIKNDPEFNLNYERIAKTFVSYGLSGKLSNRNSLLKKAILNYKKYHVMTGKCYNLSCSYALLKQRKQALFYLEKALQQKEIQIEDVKKDTDWKFYKNDKQFLMITSGMNKG